MKNILIILTLVLASTGYVYSQVNSDTVNTDVPGGGGGGGGLSAADIDTIAEFNAIIAPDVVDLSSSQTLTNKLIDGNGNTVKMLRHATDCTTFNVAFDGQYCWEKDSNIIYVCETSGICDDPSEWIPVATFASSVANTPAGDIAATDAQAAIDELDTEKVAKAGDTLTGNLLIDNQKEVRLLEADANGSNYFGFNAPASLSGDLTLTWNVTPGNCTGDGNAGCLTVNGSNEIVCSADDGGAGGAGDITDVGSCDNGACGTEGGTDIFPLIYEGSADTNETTITATDPTGDNAINLPDASGDVVLDVAPQTLTNKTLDSADNVIHADDAVALASNPTDCSANEFANAIAASGNLTCAAIADADVPDTITASNYLPLAGGTLTGLLTTDNLGVEFEESDTNPTCAAGNYNIFADLSETSFKACTNGSASKLTTFADLVDANIPNDITIDTATNAGALASNPTDCSAGEYATTIAANGNLTCAVVAGSQVSNTPAGNIAASTVQAAIDELDTEKQAALSFTGTGDTVRANSPTLVTPTLGVAAVSTINKYTFTPPATGATVTIADGKTLTVSKSMSFTAADDTGAYTFPTGTVNLADTTSTQTFTGKTMSGASNTFTNIDWSSLVNVPAFRKTLIQLRPQANEPPASSFATIYQRNGHPGLSFDGDVCAIWSFVLPNYYGGNGVTAEIYVVSTETTNDTDWDGSWDRIETTLDIDTADGSAFASAISADNNNNNGTSGIPTKVSIAFTNGAQMDSCAAGEFCRFRICRDATSDTGGTTNGQAVIIGGDLKETP